MGEKETFNVSLHQIRNQHKNHRINTVVEAEKQVVQVRLFCGINCEILMCGS